MLCLITSNLILSVLWNTFAIKNLYLCLYAHKYHKHYINYKYSIVSSATSNTILWHILTELLNKWCDYLLVLYLMYTYSVYKVAYIIWLKTRRRYITFKLISFFFCEVVSSQELFTFVKLRAPVDGERHSSSEIICI